MTISRLSAGDGYTYYTSVTARGDLDRDSSELGDYYLEGGTPQGQWLGRGTLTLGVEGIVTEQQMKALFGEGLHPNADQLIPQHISAGMSPQHAIGAVRLGRKYARFESPDNELRTAIAGAIQRQQSALGRDLTPDETTALRMRQASISFQEHHGRRGSPQEVSKFLATELTKGQNAVAGFDLTFSAPKSVSIAWAVADEAQAHVLEEAHTRAIERTIRWLEDEVIRTRTGSGGIALHTTNGLIGTRFRHWESREGDPQLHDHVVIANRVQITDEHGREKWLTVDSRGLFKATMNASSLYNRALADELKALGFDMRVRQTGNHVGVELASVSDAVIERFSSRSIAVNARTKQLVADYVRVHGRQPDTKELLGIKQRATLETRVAKSQSHTRDQLRARWRAQIGDDARLIQEATRPTAAIPPIPAAVPRSIDHEWIADAIIDDLSSRRSTWDRNHIETRINMWAAQQPHVVAPATIELITQHALDKSSIRISHDPPVPAHPELQNPDGTSIYIDQRRALYTSTRVLDAERALLDAANDIALPAVAPAHFLTAVAVHEGPLDDGQLQLARAVACDEHVLTVGIGPAGTGKTTAMRLAVAAIREAGTQSHGLTVSAAAADQLHRATGMPATTIAKWLHDLDAGHIAIRPGDVIIVDEAGMASTRDLATITQHATQAGAFIRLIGDDRQLQAIGAGGALKLIAAEAGAIRLDHVHRFTNPNEAAASLALRNHGDVDFYRRNHRIHGGTITNVFSRVVDGWAQDEAAGKTSLMMASTNHDVATLNQMAQDLRAAQGAVDRSTTVELADGSHAGIGDKIITRQNARQLTTDNGHGFVKNGDTWTLTAIHKDGAVTIADSQGRSATLPSDYVTTSTGLGYAITVHRAQGRTVDVARLIIDDRTTRESLYVGLTRGREHNEAHAITNGRTANELLEQAAANVAQARSAHELIHDAQRESNHPANLIRIMHDMQNRADQHRYSTAIRTVLPDHADMIMNSPKQPRLYAAITAAENQGFPAARILKIASTDLPSNVHDPAGLIAWRIGRHLERAHELRTAPPRRPLRGIETSVLNQLLSLAARESKSARAALRTTARPTRLKDGSDVPAWTERPHGQKTEAELAQLLRRQRNQIAAISHTISDAHEDRRSLRTQIFQEPAGNRREALKHQLANLHQRIEGLVHERQQLLKDESITHDESRIRALSVPADAAREEQQRFTGAVSEHLAKDRHEQARTTHHELQLEQHWRSYDPDDQQAHRPAGVPVWAVPGRGLADPALPTSWRKPLAEMATHIDLAIRRRGAALALDPPEWATRYLGAVPDADSAQRPLWERISGQIEAWRGLTNHIDPVKALPSPKQSMALGPSAARYLHTLHASASDLRRHALPEVTTPSASAFTQRPPCAQQPIDMPAMQSRPFPAIRTEPARLSVQQRILLKMARARLEVREAQAQLLAVRTNPLGAGETVATRFTRIHDANANAVRAQKRLDALRQAAAISDLRSLVGTVKRNLQAGPPRPREARNAKTPHLIDLLLLRAREKHQQPPQNRIGINREGPTATHWRSRDLDER